MNQLKETHSTLAKSEREASTRNESELIWVYPATIEELKLHHPELYRSVFNHETPIASKAGPNKLSQLKCVTPSRKTNRACTQAARMDRLLALVKGKPDEAPDVFMRLLARDLPPTILDGCPLRMLRDLPHQAAEGASKTDAPRTLRDVSPRDAFSA